MNCVKQLKAISTIIQFKKKLKRQSNSNFFSSIHQCKTKLYTKIKVYNDLNKKNGFPLWMTMHELLANGRIDTVWEYEFQHF